MTATYSTRDVADAADITYRQLDYWMRTGRITPSIRPPRGQGSQTIWSDSDVQLVRRVASLTGMGLDIDAAFDLANQATTLVPITDDDRALIVQALIFTAGPESVLSLDGADRDRMLAIAEELTAP